MMGLLILIFVFLGSIHVYWAFGGQWAADTVLPTNSAGKRMLNPSTLMTLVVSIGLFAFAMYYMVVAGWIHFYLPSWLQLLAGWGIPSIFLLRVIGDFQYVGLFKKITQSEFAQADSRYFVPLCLGIAILGFFLKIFP